jgi:hypothetical protein
MNRFQVSTIAALLAGIAISSPALAQDAHAHGAAAAAQQDKSAPQDARDNALVDAVRRATDGFQNSRVAEAAGYALALGCVSNDSTGAMGVHFVNGDLVGDGVLDVNHPEAILYEPDAAGQFRLTAVEYIVLADGWNAAHNAPPQLMGQLFHLNGSPNRFGLPAFYALHVWAWKDNPNGTFTNWNPRVSCDGYAGQNP